ncbi:MAG: hypothetical protein ACKOAD_08395 [Gammaproteobacteria bacterium]
MNFIEENKAKVLSFSEIIKCFYVLLKTVGFIVLLLLLPVIGFFMLIGLLSGGDGRTFSWLVDIIGLFIIFLLGGFR